MRLLYLLCSFVSLSITLAAQPSADLELCPLGGVGFHLPDTIQLGDTLRYSMTFTLPDGCANLVEMSIEETPTGIIHRLYRACPTTPCTDIVRAGIASAEFIPRSAGTYFFQVGVHEQVWTSTSMVVSAPAE